MNHKRFNYEGKWALVTGASSGIGKAFAYELAGRRTNLILSSRSRTILGEMADDLGARFGVQAEVVAADLAVSDAAERLFRKVKNLNYNVQVLINNAGFGSYGRLQENPVERSGGQILSQRLFPRHTCAAFSSRHGCRWRWGHHQRREHSRLSTDALHGNLRSLEGIPALVLRSVMGREFEHRSPHPCALSRSGGYRVLRSVRRG
jgi:NAD(P)-dependent dehydrogenase (short-subunit alcohol dehydrogenase family)